MALTSTFTTISAGQTDANSPLDEVLMDAIRQDIDVLYEWLGGPTYTPSTSHDHDGVNSAQVDVISSFPDATTGTYVESLCYLPATYIGDPTGSYTEALRIRVARAGNYTVKTGALEEVPASNVRIKLYRNGSAIGVEHDLGSTTIWQFWDENASASQGDVFQLYMKRGGTTSERADAKMAVMSGNPTAPAPSATAIDSLLV